jgi:hypothetical protein
VNATRAHCHTAELAQIKDGTAAALLGVHW